METGVIHLLEASIKTRCSMQVTTRALILYHHFMRCAAEIHYDESMVAAVALNISGRINEQYLDLDSLLCVFYSIVNQTTEVLSADDVAFILLKKTVATIDFLMLRMLEFNLNHRSAIQYLVPYLAMIAERSKNLVQYYKELGRTCVRLIADFYTSRHCLDYPPEHIAVACIDHALYIHGFISHLDVVPAWYQGICSDLPVEKVKEMKTLMRNQYEKFVPTSKYDKKKNQPVCL